jgi:hypothetical protein
MHSPDLSARIQALGELWWQEINLGDLNWFAHRLMSELSVTLPDQFPSRENGVVLVELVESTLLVPSPQHVVRCNTPAELVERCDRLAHELREQNLVKDDDATNLLAALYAWLGCIGMAKTLREVDSQGNPYTDEIRRRDYAGIERQWDEPGGEWVRYGVTLARELEHERMTRSGDRRELVDDWVPGDSPYWTES